MNGAESIIQSARSCGIDVCFANPGTTEIPLVAALDAVGGIRPVLCLFEGVCTGAADGYARMLDKPAMVLLHLGVGLANGTANLHNARRAHTPIVVVVGEHATWHRPLDPPLAMDIESIASSTSGWLRTCRADSLLGRDMADGVSAALEGQVAILIVPYDLQMKRCEQEMITLTAPYREEVDHARIEEALGILGAGTRTALVLGGRALRKDELMTAARIRSACGCDLLSEGFPARMERGAGLPDVTRIPYLPEPALELLKHYDALVFAGANEPVLFFGYSGVPGRLVNDRQKMVHLTEPGHDATSGLTVLAHALGAPESPSQDDLEQRSKPALPFGPLSGRRPVQ